MEFRRLEDTIRDWGDRYGETITDIERSGKNAVWRERIAACRSSGIGVKAWCDKNGISASSYYKWQKKLFCLASQSSPQFAEICVVPVAKISATVHLGDLSVDIYSGADAETTAMLLQVLRHAE